MSATSTRVAAYLVALVVVFAGAFGVGRLVGPVGPEPAVHEAPVTLAPPLGDPTH